VGTKDPGPRRAFVASVAIFVAVVVAVVVLWALVGAWNAVIALAVAFVGIFGLLIYAFKRLSDESEGAAA